MYNFVSNVYKTSKEFVDLYSFNTWYKLVSGDFPFLVHNGNCWLVFNHSGKVKTGELYGILL